MAIEITIDSARTIALQLVAERGAEYTYVDSASIAKVGGCYYTAHPQHEPITENDHRHETGCMVGEILMRSGVSASEIDGYIMTAPNLLNILQGNGVINTDVAVNMFLKDLQYAQDSGTSWSRSLEYAESRNL